MINRIIAQRCLLRLTATQPMRGDIIIHRDDDPSESSLFDLNAGIALIWSERVNYTDLWVVLWLSSPFREYRASSSLGSVERRLISLIFAGRNRIIMIRRELPLTVSASPVEPVA